MKLLERVLSKRKIITSILCAFYVIIIVRLTLIDRVPVTKRTFKPELFWAFRSWVRGDTNGKTESIQYIQNILLFVPFGFLFPVKDKTKDCILCALVLSIAIEITQFVTVMGWCEIDDVISNTLGAIIGFFIFKWVATIYQKYWGDSHVD